MLFIFFLFLFFNIYLGDCFRGWSMALQMRAKSLDSHSESTSNVTNQEDLQRYFR